jgi:hypothetical protein
MKTISTGFGLCALGICIICYPALDRLISRANAFEGASNSGASSSVAPAIDTPVVIWMSAISSSGLYMDRIYRLWSDGRLETREIYFVVANFATCSGQASGVPCGGSNWTEVPPPTAGNGFACRADLDGNRTIDGADLGMILANWGPQPPCEPEATFPCMPLSAGNFARLSP